MDRLQVVFGQQVGTELEVVVEVKGASGLEASPEGGDGGRLDEVSHGLDAAELTGAGRGGSGRGGRCRWGGERGERRGGGCVGRGEPLPTTVVVLVLVLVAVLVAVLVLLVMGHACRGRWQVSWGRRMLLLVMVMVVMMVLLVLWAMVGEE